ncbi:N5-glutamine methyltransferase family protein [Citricoccus sp. NR2]|uniref:N5-glutamine methyltransferase family protein n=1 Tax=Citricoccus sp. NR2 TaxID=3004095 RepID=UPI0022DE15D2|nr:HemK/PrmC family methyltransferase [Citricoccus sp. NR2]WBL18638.1 peptide chain release factor N(5)-glutamine methyltransferase [Citricoccus sp. NR2]
MASDLGRILSQATARLSTAGVDSPRYDARVLAAHVLNIELGRLEVLLALGHTLTDDETASLNSLLSQREQRVPLQLILGRVAFAGVELDVASGVFIPRPETELLAEEALKRMAAEPYDDELIVIDLCTGTGALAAALVHGLRTHAGQRSIQVHAVEIDPHAHTLARRNLDRWDVEVHLGDATAPESLPRLVPLLGTVDAVVSNPPYVPERQPVTQLEAQADPALALYGGSPDGTLIPLRIADAAARLLRPGGLFLMEHDETHATALVEALQTSGFWDAVTVHLDLADRPRFLSARRADLVVPRPGPVEV